MFALPIFVSLTAALFVGSANAYPPAPPGTVFCETFVAVTGPPITAITNGTVVTGYQLAVDYTTPTLTNPGFTGSYSFLNGGIGAWDYCHYWYLNVGLSSHSYKPLTWAFDHQQTTTWVAAEGSIIKANATAAYPATSKFLACKVKQNWVLYLQTGTDAPSGATCVVTQLYAEPKSSSA